MKHPYATLLILPICPTRITSFISTSAQHSNAKPTKLEIITISSSLFKGCSSLKEIPIPDTVTEIGERALYGCSGISEIHIPENIKSIGDYAFFGCSGVSSLEIPEEITSIGAYAFHSCSNLTTASFPNVTSINNGCFGGCVNLNSVYVENSTLHSIDNGYGQDRQIITNVSNKILYAAVGGILKA